MGENNNIYYIYISPLIISYFYIKIKLNKKKRDSASIIENEKEKDKMKEERTGIGSPHFLFSNKI
jgi:hypothetical protein